MARGRKPIELNNEEVRKLAALHCTVTEMAEFFGVSTDTLRNNYSAEIDKGRAEGKETLRRLQWQAAKRGNVAMLIWLGKQYLDQKEKSEITDIGPKAISLSYSVKDGDQK